MSRLNHGNRLLHSALLLTIAAVCTKVLSIGYRIPYQNITGDIGFYIYQQVYPIHGIVFTLAMYGFPVVIAKLVVEWEQKEKQVLLVSFFILTVVSVVFVMIFLMFAQILATLAGDAKLAPLYRTISLSILFVPFISVLRGLFQAKENVIPTALSQISEQLIRVIVIVTLAFYFMTHGFSVYAAGFGAAVGSVAGAMASVMTLGYFFARAMDNVRRRRMPIQWKQAAYIAKRLIVQGFAISIGALAFVLFQFVDSVTMLNQLQQFGYSSFEAKTLKGVYDRSQPLLQLGFTLATSLSLVVVPAIASAIVRNDEQAVRMQAGFALKMTFVIGIAASFGLAIIAEPTNIMLFKDSRGSALLAIFGSAIFFGSLAITSIAILQGADQVKGTMRIVMSGLIVKCFINIVWIPIYGIYAAAVGTVIGFAVMAVYSLWIVHRQFQIFSTYSFHFFRMMFALSGMVIVVSIWKVIFQTYVFTGGRLGATGLALSSVFVAVVTYFCLLLVCRVFLQSELDVFRKKRKDVVREN